MPRSISIGRKSTATGLHAATFALATGAFGALLPVMAASRVLAAGPTSVAPVAEKLIDGGHRLTVFDIREDAMRPLLDRQARRAASPKDLADQCEIVFVSLPTLAAFQAVATGPSSDSGRKSAAAPAKIAK